MRQSTLLKRFTSENGTIHVTGDIDHTFETQQFIKGDLKIEFRMNTEDADEMMIVQENITGGDGVIIESELTKKNPWLKNVSATKNPANNYNAHIIESSSYEDVTRRADSLTVGAHIVDEDIRKVIKTIVVNADGTITIEFEPKYIPSGYGFHAYMNDQPPETILTLLPEPVTSKYEIVGFPLNKSFKTLRVRPQTTRNSSQVFPSEQVDLLPYLTERQVYDNIYDTSLNTFEIPWDGFEEKMQDGNRRLPNLLPSEGQYAYDMRFHESYFISSRKPISGVVTEVQIVQDIIKNNEGFGLLGSIDICVNRDDARLVRKDAAYTVKWTDGGAHNQAGFEGIALNPRRLNFTGSAYDYELGLSTAGDKYTLDISMDAFNQGSTDVQLTDVFKFDINNVGTFVNFDEFGRGFTFNPEKSIPDSEHFHIYKIWEMGEEIDGSDAEKLRARAGNLIYPTVAQLNGGLMNFVEDTGEFPFQNAEVYDNCIKELYLYVPKKRFQRGHVQAQAYVPLFDLLDPRKLANTKLEQQNAIFSYVNRELDLEDRSYTFYRNAPFEITKRPVFSSLDMIDLVSTVSTGRIIPRFVNVGDAAAQQNKEISYQISGYFVEGEMKVRLLAIMADADIENNAVLAFVIHTQFEFQKDGEENGLPAFWGNNVTIDRQVADYYELLYFNKGDLVYRDDPDQADQHGLVITTGWKTPLYKNRLTGNLANGQFIDEKNLEIRAYLNEIINDADTAAADVISVQQVLAAAVDVPNEPPLTNLRELGNRFLEGFPQEKTLQAFNPQYIRPGVSFSESRLEANYGLNDHYYTVRANPSAFYYLFADDVHDTIDYREFIGGVNVEHDVELYRKALDTTTLVIEHNGDLSNAADELYEVVPDVDYVIGLIDNVKAYYAAKLGVFYQYYVDNFFPGDTYADIYNNLYNQDFQQDTQASQDRLDFYFPESINGSFPIIAQFVVFLQEIQDWWLVDDTTQKLARVQAALNNHRDYILFAYEAGLDTFKNVLETKTVWRIRNPNGEHEATYFTADDEKINDGDLDFQDDERQTDLPRDTNLDALRTSLTSFIYEVKFPETYFQQYEMPVVRAALQHTQSFEEPFFGFYGMSHYLPSSVFPIAKTFPPFLQDFEYFFERQAFTHGVRTAHSYNYNAVMIPEGNVELQIESYNSFDQRDKELESVNLPWPYMEQFKATSNANDTEITVRTRTIRGPPDYIFLQMRHSHESGTNPFAEMNPIIKTLSMSIFGQELTCVSKLNERGLYHLTRRNSNLRSDTQKNYKEHGAVLLTAKDCGNFQQWKGDVGVDLFDMDITVTEFDYNGTVHTNILPVTLNAIFLYKDYGLSGKVFDNEFNWSK